MSKAKPEDALAPSEAPEAPEASQNTRERVSGPESGQSAPEASHEALPSLPKQDKDQVAMVSLRADGSPDQTDEYLVIGEGES